MSREQQSVEMGCLSAVQVRCTHLCAGAGFRFQTGYGGFSSPVKLAAVAI